MRQNGFSVVQSETFGVEPVGKNPRTDLHAGVERQRFRGFPPKVARDVEPMGLGLSFAPAIPMVKTPKPCSGVNFGSWRRPVFHWPPIRRVLVERIVSPILMMVGHVITD